MPRRKRTPEEIARKERTKALMKELNIKDMDDIQDLFKSFVAAALEGGLEAELDEELGYSKYDYRNKETNNSRNGYSKKTMKTSFGDMDIDIPRDRNGDFEPKLIQKHQTTLSGDIEEKIISMYAKGMTENDIAAHIEEIYGLDVSDSTISRVTDKILPIAKESITSVGGSLCCSIYGCDTLSCAIRRTYSQKGCVHSNKYKFRWQKRCSWYVGWPFRVASLLAYAT